MNVDHLLLAIDRDQSTIENYAISIWFLVATALYMCALLPLPLAIPVAAIAIQLPLCSGAGARANAAVLMLLQFAAAAYFASAASPVRYVAWFSLTLFVTNSLAWLIMLLLRDSSRELERRCGV